MTVRQGCSAGRHLSLFAEWRPGGIPWRTTDALRNSKSRCQSSGLLPLKPWTSNIYWAYHEHEKRPPLRVKVKANNALSISMESRGGLSRPLRVIVKAHAMLLSAYLLLATTQPGSMGWWVSQSRCNAAIYLYCGQHRRGDGWGRCKPALSIAKAL